MAVIGTLLIPLGGGNIIFSSVLLEILGRIQSQGKEIPVQPIL
jgi:hypothetical protein